MAGTAGGSIWKRLTGMILLIVTVVTLVSYGLFAVWYVHHQKRKSHEEAQIVAYVIAQDLAKLVLLNNVSAASDISAKLDSFPFLNWLVLYKTDGTPLYQYSKSHQNFHVNQAEKKVSGIGEDNALVHTVRAVYQQRYLGDIRLSIEVRTVKEILYRNIVWFVSIYLLMILCSYFLAYHYAKKFTKPILKLVHFLETIDFSNLHQQRIDLHEKNEFAILEAKINTMLLRLEEAFSQQRIAAVAFETPSGMIITDADKKVIQVNRAYTEITGYTLADVAGKKPPVLRADGEESDRYRVIERALHAQHYWAGEIQNCKKDGRYFSEYLSIQEVRDADKGRVTHYVFSFIDLSLQKEIEKKVAYLMQYDPLTGLANKSLLVKTINEANSSASLNMWHALIGFDIKDFKMINDAYGYETGDRILQEITSRLKEAFSESALIAKIGVDEFMLSYHALEKEKAAAIIRVQLIAEYLHTLMSKSFTIDDKMIHISIQVGINLYHSEEGEADTVLKNTDAALQLAKKEGQKSAFFHREIEAEAQQYLDIYTDLHHAVEHESFELYYQPQYTHEGKICGAEALIRWKHEKKGMISPMEFIPIAEKSGLILDIGKWVLYEACQQLSDWSRNPLFSHLTLSVNVSAKQFATPDFVAQVQHAVISNGISYHKLKLELVESVLLVDREKSIEKMKLLRQLGIKICMDDFGTGYSSLEYLKVLPLDQIKIDGSFVKHMHTDPKDYAIVKSMISLGEAFGFEVVAEGVESREDVEMLQALGCYCYQGFFFSKPVTITDFIIV
jgi:diguanylate cyclase (GGDEF)-like protein/PAS domain S-box-containing protein